MEFDQNNKVIQLCTQGMEAEGKGNPDEAGRLFAEAWNLAATDFEKFTAAHYVARHQKNIAEKLKWDETALLHALRVNDDKVKLTLPSLYLNIGKCYEELKEFDLAKVNYEAASSFQDFLPDDGYGRMITAGIANAKNRIMNTGK